MYNTDLSINSKNTSNNIVIFGASGFLGKHILAGLIEFNLGNNSLNETGVNRIICCARSNNKLRQLVTYGSPDQIITVPFDVTAVKKNVSKLDSILSRASTVIYCVGDLFANGDEDYLYNIAPTFIAEKAYKKGIRNFVLISALGANKKTGSNYMSAKNKGEQNVQKVCPSATIIRPSYIFGNDDSLVCKYASLSSLFYFLPLPNYGKTLLSPVSAFDIAKACRIVISNEKWHGKCLNLCANKPATIKKIVALTIEACKRNRIIVPLPLFLFWSTAWFNDILGLKIISKDQLKMMKADSVSEENKCKDFASLGIKPTQLSEEVANIVKRYRDGAGRLIESL